LTNATNIPEDASLLHPVIIPVDRTVSIMVKMNFVLYFFMFIYISLTTMAGGPPRQPLAATLTTPPCGHPSKEGNGVGWMRLFTCLFWL